MTGDTGSRCSALQLFQNSALDARIPEITQTGVAGQADTFLVTSLFLEDARFAAVLDPFGHIVWSRSVDVDAPRVLLDQAGDALLVGGMDSPSIDTPEGLIVNPHSVQRLADGSLLVFNRGKSVCSSVVRLVVDEGNHSATELARYQSPDCLEVVLFGDARMEADGRTFIAWSSSGRMEELPALDGANTRQADLGLGGVFGFIQPVTAL